MFGSKITAQRRCVSKLIKRQRRFVVAKLRANTKLKEEEMESHHQVVNSLPGSAVAPGLTRCEGLLARRVSKLHWKKRWYELAPGE